jgi:drug/metabolite transporter (DMT)-like permease
VNQVITRPPGADLARLSVAIVFIALSGPLIVATAAPPLAIAFWRCLIAGGATGLFVIVRERAAFCSLTRRELRLTACAGILLGLHFAAWIPSLTLTSIASSTAAVATQPIWAAVIARTLGVRIPRAAWIGIAIAFSGVILLGGIDFSIEPRALIGDALALVSAVLAAAYVTVAERVRQTVPTATMTSVLYFVSALTIIPIALIAGQSFIGFSAQAWLMILVITAGAQLLGHTLMNKVLATTSATVVSLAILLEMPGATIIAAIFLGQIPALAAFPAIALILAGLVIVIRSSSPRAVTESSPI